MHSLCSSTRNLSTPISSPTLTLHSRALCPTHVTCYMLCVRARSVQQQDLARLAVRRCECGAHHFEGEEAQVPGEYGAANRSQELRPRERQTILRHHQVLSFTLI